MVSPIFGRPVSTVFSAGQPPNRKEDAHMKGWVVVFVLLGLGFFAGQYYAKRKG